MLLIDLIICHRQRSVDLLRRSRILEIEKALACIYATPIFQNPKLVSFQKFVELNPNCTRIQKTTLIWLWLKKSDRGKKITTNYKKAGLSISY